MAVSSASDDSGIVGEFPVRLDRYDVHLLGIPIALFASVLVHLVLGLTLHTTLSVASVASVFVILDAMFLNPPTRRRGAT